MAYNPYDDVIDQDPAYMSTGGGLQVDVMSDQGFKDFFKVGRDYLQSQGEDPFGGAYSVADIERIGRDISNAQPGQANVIAQQPVQEPPTTVPVPQFISEGEQIRDKQEKLQQIEDTVPGAFYQSMQDVYKQRQQEDFSQQKKVIGAGGEYAYDFIVPEETAARAKEKSEKNKQVLEQLGFNLGQMNREQMAEAQAQGYDPLTIGESLSKIPDFLFGDQLKAFRKLRKGEPLEAGEGYALLTVPLDILDFAGIGLLGGVATAGTYKLIQRLKKKYFDEAGVPDIKGILDNQNYAFDPDVQEAKRIFGGPAQIPGLPIEQGGRGQTVMMDVADRPGGSSFSFNADDIKLPESTHFRAKDTDEKFKKLILENPEGTSLKSKEWFRENYGMETITYDNALKRFEQANPDFDFSNFKRDPKKSARANKEIAEEKARQEFAKQIEGLKTIEDVMKVTGRSYHGAYEKIKTVLGVEGLRKFGVSPVVQSGETAAKVDEFLSANKNRNFTLPELAQEMGIPYPTVQSQSKNITHTSNIVSNEFRRGEMHDSIISEMNRLLKDIDTGKIPANKGPQYYQDAGYNIQMASDKNVIVRPYIQFPEKGNKQVLSIKNRDLKKRLGKKFGSVDQDVESILNYIHFGSDTSASKRNALKIKLRDLYRSLSPKNQQILYDNITDTEAFGFVPKKIINEYGVVVNNLEWSETVNRRAYNNLYAVIESLTTPKDIKKLQELQKMKKSLNRYTDKKFYDALKNNDAFRKQFIDQVNRVDPNNEYNNDWEAMYRAYKGMFNGHLSHVAPTRKLGTDAKPFSKAPGLEGKFGETGLINLNFDNHNISLQPRIENATEAAVKDLTKARTVGDRTEAIQRIIRNNRELKKRNMIAYMRFTDDEMSDAVFDYLKKQFPDQVFKTTDKYGKTPAGIKTFILGDPKPPTVNDLKRYFDSRLDIWLKDPKTFKLSAAVPDGKNVASEQMMIEGDAPYIFMRKLLPSSFKKGGPVKMAIGGDPLTNLNQQQFAPDPAFEGPDYFQEAVDSGNLQAVNLFNLFKVFKKPKVMATPSNVKQVEQARDPMPQGVPGSQELQPLPQGKPDFFFKSYLLDQLNLPNAPKASTPQGWREFLIKGKKVPEAEMLDTGILQYLEDTEKFYPNKKITKQEIEDLYDMSPLGNLEVRVKPVRGYPEGENVPQESFEFFADQGTQKHRGVGSAAIDESMDTYFEVVVNVPTLPGQERAFVNSSHFSEPNVLGFTRVGTYKNNKGETVAVIQEMQTDMLTEVRKEQERLFAMVNALKRERAKLVDQAQNSPNPDYYKNELRLFDQKYPPGRLDALETNNLIQPFPNIVAKDLIPERTASLNSIQEQINKLMMGNVEQYNDPAYKTMVFDLAQQQNKIFEDLASMNRSANYEETLRDFKVPGTADRDELHNIAYRDEYLPSSYNLKQVQSFPPIPFNKQADYVDLLLKSTIKAAKGKGIDKVAIMPADVGANPRWGKSSDEAKKKFQNLYDKVGVQQLKNIAKKYGGKLEIEKIIDKNKGTRGLTFLNKNPDGEFQILKQTETRKEISDADRDKYYDEEITRIASGVTEPGDVVITREIAPGQMMDYYVVEGRGDATDVGYRMIPLKDGESADDAMIKIVEYNPSEVDMYTISFDPSKLEEPMYLFKKKSGGTIDKDSLVSITDIYGEYGR